MLAAGVPLAQDMKAPDQTAAAPASQPAAQMPMGSHMSRMDEHMQLMKTLHEKLQGATTPEARRIVMDKQREEMQGCMAMMNEMKPGDGKMGSVGGGMMARKGTPADAAAQMPMMQHRIDMMEMMVQAMMDQQGMTAAPMK